MARKRSPKRFMNIEDLPHLHFIFCRAQEYYQRVLLLESSKDIQVITAPRILMDEKIYLTIDKCNDRQGNSSWKMDTKPINGCHCYNGEVTKGEKQYMDTMVSTKTDEQDSQFCCLEVRLQPHASDEGEHYTPTEADEDCLIRLLEENIFKYVDAVNKILIKNARRDENISLIIAMGKAILLEKDYDVPDAQNKCLADIHAQLNGLNDDDIIGYGYSDDGLHVLILEQGKSDEEKDIITKKIINIVSPNNPRFIWCQSKPFNFKASPGEYVVSETNQDKYKKIKTGYGSIGIFGKTENNEFVFTTAGHVFPQGVGENAFIPVSDSETKLEHGKGENLPSSLRSTENLHNVKRICDKETDDENKGNKRRKISDGNSKDLDIVQMAKGVRSGEGKTKETESDQHDKGASMGDNVICATDTNFEKIGQCIAHLGAGPGNEPDFAVIKIDKNKFHSCKVNNFTNCKPCPSEISLYTGNHGELQGRFVQRIGPESICMEGIVEMDPFFFSADTTKRAFISIKSKNPGGQFAQPGHSGATVFRIVTKNRKPRAEIVSTILMGDTKIDQKHAVYTHRMDDDLKELEQQKNIKLEIFNSNDQN